MRGRPHKEPAPQSGNGMAPVKVIWEKSTLTPSVGESGVTVAQGGGIGM